MIKGERLCVPWALLDQIICGITVHTANSPIQDMGRLMRANPPARRMAHEAFLRKPASWSSPLQRQHRVGQQEPPVQAPAPDGARLSQPISVGHPVSDTWSSTILDS